MDEIDWDGMPRSERIEANKQLFAALQGIAQAKGVSIALLLDQIFEPALPTSSDYSNLRKGEMSIARSKLIHRHLEEYHFDQARILAPSLFQMNPRKAFDCFLDRHHVEGGLRIIPPREFGIVRPARDAVSHVQTIALGQEFALELTSPYDGACIAFQGYQGKWHSIALDERQRYPRVAIRKGRQIIPRTGTGDPIPLCEEHWSGPNSFAVITSNNRNMPVEPRHLTQITDDQSLRVYRTEVRFTPSLSD